MFHKARTSGMISSRPKNLESLLVNAGLTVTAKRRDRVAAGQRGALSDDMALNYILERGGGFDYLRPGGLWRKALNQNSPPSVNTPRKRPRSRGHQQPACSPRTLWNLGSIARAQQSAAGIRSPA